MTKDIYHIKTHRDGKSHEMVIYKINSVKCKITYEAGNAYERCTVEFFDGNKFSPIFDIWDLGCVPDSSVYVWDNKKRESRATAIIELAVTASEILLK
jgi:hypothetical protein